MAWVPDGAPKTIFDDIPAATWHDIHHGASLDISTAPHRQRQPVYGFRVTKNFEDKVGGIKYRVGMQGQLHEVDERKQQGRIFIQGVTERDGYKHCWVPLRCIEKGKLWEMDMQNWQVKIMLPGQHQFDTRNWNSASSPDTTTLCPPKFVEYLGKQDVPSLTNRIIDGIKRSGLYDTLSSDRPFSFQDLVSASRYNLQNFQASGTGGVYVRFHKTGEQVGFRWVPRSSYAYVGHTTNFAKRNNDHRSNYTSSYGNLTRNSDALHMIALCVLPELSDLGLYFLVEQIFVCMLGTYRPEVLSQESQDVSMMGFVEHARYFTAMSKEVFRITIWQGMLQRGFDSCKVRYGANCSSPVIEYAYKSEKFLFIREDIDIKEGNSIVPMAIYRRSDRHVRTGPTAKSIVVRTRSIENRKSKQLMAIYSPVSRSKTAGLDEPPTSWPYELVIEVRKDGSKHPHAWARLPDIGCFENWQQANSWAARIQWEYPRGSGLWRFMYVQSGRTFKLADASIPGSLKNYMKGITFLQWITGSEPNHSHSWIPKVQGKARVMQCEKDMMNQTFVFRSNQDPIQMLSGDIISDNDTTALMLKPEHGLRANVPFGDFGGAAVGKRKLCDTCNLVQGFLDKDIFPDKTCVQDPQNNKRCTTCKHFGRPCCSWTSGLPSLRTVAESQLAPNQQLFVEKFQSILVRLPIARISPNLQSFHQQFRSLNDVQEEADVDSDNELNEDEEEGDSDEE